MDLKHVFTPSPLLEASSIFCHIKGMEEKWMVYQSIDSLERETEAAAEVRDRLRDKSLGWYCLYQFLLQ